jgi:tetratricopeptide (TPR) repeat protein
MKTKITLFSSLVAAAILAGCGGLGKMEKRIEELGAKAEPEPLIVKGDKVALNVSGKYPPKYFHKKVVVEATPVLVYPGGESAFKMKGYQGESAAGNYEVIPYANGKSFSYSDEIKFVSGMGNKGELQLRIKGSKGSKSQEFAPLKIGTGVIITPYLVQNDDKPIMGKDKFVRILPFSQNAQINYEYNSSVVRPGELKDQDILDLAKFIKDNATNERIQIKTSEVQAYASPEGEMTLNENLAKERAASANKVVADEYKKNKINAPQGFYVDVPKGEDWDGFKKLMDESNIEDRNLIVRVLEMYPDPAKREQEMKNMAKTYQEVERTILPKLRRSMISLKYDKVGYSDDELKSLVKSNPDILTAEEILYAATLYTDLNEKLAIYKDAERIHANDFRGANNAGYVLMLQNKLNDAETQFNKAWSIKNDPVVANNLGIVARQKGDRDKALNYLNQASGAGSEVNYNKGIINIQNGDYGTAISNFGSENTFNKALAQVLNGDNSGAKSTLDASKDESAFAYYLRAIIGARTNSGSEVSSNLKKAVEKDSSLRNKALEDLEFRNFKGQLGI